MGMYLTSTRNSTVPEKARHACVRQVAMIWPKSDRAQLSPAYKQI